MTKPEDGTNETKTLCVVSTPWQIEVKTKPLNVSTSFSPLAQGGKEGF